LQARINAALRERPGEPYSSFSPYMPDHRRQITRRMTEAALPGGTAGVEAALDVFDELAAVEDLGRLRYALMVFLTHHPAVAELGLRLPSLEERSPSSVLPSRRPRPS
jgi:hypothetical protein